MYVIKTSSLHSDSGLKVNSIQEYDYIWLPIGVLNNLGF